MRFEKIGICLDAGNSESRIEVFYDDGTKEEIIRFKNSFAWVPNDYIIPESYKNAESTILTIGDEDYANGLLAVREFEDVLQRPLTLHPKHDQDSTFRTLSLSFIKAIMFVADYFKVGVDELDVSVDISVLLPPLEMYYEDALKTLISKINTVSLVLPYKIVKKFKIENIAVFPEGLAAFIGVMYEEKDGKLVEVVANKKFLKGTSVLIDIGGGSTDVAIVRNGRVIEKSQNTFRIGGNTVKSIVAKVVSMKHNYSMTEEEKEYVLENGHLVVGDEKKIDLLEDIKIAKKKYADMLIKSLNEHLEGINIEIESLKGILTVGGGALAIEETVTENGIPHKKVLSEPMSKPVVEHLKKYNDSISEISLNGIDARLVNLKGLGLIHKHKLL
ncbi:ParM/StbA family protein [Clostridioides difficile]|uniref:ParM/StbA family protein n=1 Tax=Clostridioides difficile TaxID=1496 RepID=UPI000D1E54D0|nr:ParM/StbA family protein [Clostridioides difficile]HBE9444602.1 ParM/StbA family protein [Clostridioides difficile]HBF1820700.1 ParM/StbA family protein [Clostridioides difficile]